MCFRTEIWTKINSWMCTLDIFLPLSEWKHVTEAKKTYISKHELHEVTVFYLQCRLLNKVWLQLLLLGCGLWSTEEQTPVRMNGVECWKTIWMKRREEKKGFWMFINPLHVCIPYSLQKPGNDESWWQEFPFRGSETKLVNWLHN